MRYDRRPDWENLRRKILPNPWDNLERHRHAVAYCTETVERVLGALTAHLNAALSVRHGTRYWRILLGRWLTYHVQQMYDHYVIIEDAFSAYPDLRTMQLEPSSFQTPTDTLDFVQMSFKDSYHLQIFSNFISAHDGRFPAQKLAADSTPPVVVYPRKRLIAFLKRLFSRILAFAVPPGIGDILVSEINLLRSERRRFFLGSRLKVLPYFAELPADFEFGPILDEKRLGLGRIMEGRDAFERVLISTLPQHFPTLFLEGYGPARDFSLARLWRTPRAIFSAVAWECSEAFKFVAAECSERGSSIWGIQHGGVYGLFEHADGEKFERGITDRFYSWGWAPLAKDLKVKDLPHPQLCRMGLPTPGEKILFVPAAMFLYTIRFGRGSNGRLAADYIERQARFLRSLPDILQKKSDVRPHVDFGWRAIERLKDHYPPLSIDDNSKPFQTQLLKARLAVFDCPATTFLEALAANVPSILTWNPDAWTFRPEARPYFDKLKETGILFDEPEAAARQATRVYDDPRGWWDSPSVREAREAFAARFALRRDDWLDLWLAEVRNA